MTARTHDLAAATTLLLVALVQPPAQLTLATLRAAVLAKQLGGIGPDIGQPTAPLWRNLPEGHVVGKLFGKLLGGHRFVSHSLLGLALFGWLSNLLLHALHPVMLQVALAPVWWAFVLGYLSHLFMDSLTKEGVPWLLPIPYKFGLPPLRRLRLTTGKSAEALLVFPLLVAVDVWLCAHYYDRLLAIVHRTIS